jgi:hypothetical protein
MRTLSLLVLLSACAPEAEDLYGLWVNIDEGTVRGLEFFSTEDTDTDPNHYRVYNYAEGEASAEVQRGRYEVLQGDGWELVTTVEWDVDGSRIGTSFGNPIRSLSKSKLKLEIDEATGDTRTYRSEDALP